MFLQNASVQETLRFLTKQLQDLDLNLDMFAVDTANIWVAGDAIASGRTVPLNETSADSGIFTGSIETRYGRGVFASDSILEVVGGEQVTAVIDLVQAQVASESLICLPTLDGPGGLGQVTKIEGVQ